MVAIVAFDNTTFYPGNDDIDISKFSLPGLRVIF